MIRRYRAALALLACLLGLPLWAALAPLSGKDRALLYEIPQGAWQRRMAGDLPERAFDGLNAGIATLTPAHRKAADEDADPCCCE